MVTHRPPGACRWSEAVPLGAAGRTVPRKRTRRPRRRSAIRPTRAAQCTTATGLATAVRVRETTRRRAVSSNGSIVKRYEPSRRVPTGRPSWRKGSANGCGWYSRTTGTRETPVPESRPFTVTPSP